MMHHWMIAVSSDQTCLTHIGVAAIVSAAICVVVDIVRKKIAIYSWPDIFCAAVAARRGLVSVICCKMATDAWSIARVAEAAYAVATLTAKSILTLVVLAQASIQTRGQRSLSGHR